MSAEATAHTKEQILSWSAENNGSRVNPEDKRAAFEMTIISWKGEGEAERLKVKMMNAVYAGR